MALYMHGKQVSQMANNSSRSDNYNMKLVLQKRKQAETQALSGGAITKLSAKIHLLVLVSFFDFFILWYPTKIENVVTSETKHEEKNKPDALTLPNIKMELITLVNIYKCSAKCKSRSHCSEHLC